MKEKLINTLKAFDDSIDYENEKSLVTGEIIDSISLVSLITSIEDEFGIEIPMEEVRSRNFDNIDSMLKLITRLTEGK